MMLFLARLIKDYSRKKKIDYDIAFSVAIGFSFLISAIVVTVLIRDVTLRYFYPSVILNAIMVITGYMWFLNQGALAFKWKYFGKRFICLSLTGASFLIVIVNYYNWSSQYIMQYRAGISEAKVLSEVIEIAQRTKKRVGINIYSEFDHKIYMYFTEYNKYFNLGINVDFVSDLSKLGSGDYRVSMDELKGDNNWKIVKKISGEPLPKLHDVALKINKIFRGRDNVYIDAGSSYGYPSWYLLEKM
ncbi:MAG: hypothetical protein HQK54_01945 [Oligoflexales bacterium]|nr:hypothetical protein [Oligoflexales bacterium]